MRIFMTGPNGYYGSIMVQELVEAGHEEVVLDTNLFQEIANSAEALAQNNSDQ